MPSASQTDDVALMTPATGRWSRTDSLLLATLLGLALFAILRSFDWRATPVEDAAMLLRYAENFANGHGIRWNIDSAPVDGATDFLFMVATGLLSRIAHIGVTTACRILVLGAHLLSIALVFVGGRRIVGGNRWVCAALALYLMAGPATWMAEGCFGAPFFAAALLCCWCAALVYADGNETWGQGVLAAFFGLLSGLIRPEGVLIAFILMAATIYRIGMRRAFPMVVSFVSVFVLLGGPYFLWRWHYFGAPLPNPFYVKGGGHLYPDSVIHAMKNLSQLLFPVLPLIPLGWASVRTRRLTNSLAIVLVSFACMWILLNNWNNHFMRFQYAIVPVVLVTVPGLLVDLDAAGFPRWATLSAPARRSIALASVLVTLGSTGYIYKLFGFNDTAAGMRRFAERLQPLAAKGHTIAVTEAGVLPLYSHWKVIDGLGLNDATIAHHGNSSITSYFEEDPPDVIMIHVDSLMPRPELMILLDGGEPIAGSVHEAFTRMGSFAVQHHYTVAAAFGVTPCNLHVYWVRPGIADYDAIVSTIRDHPYIFLDNGTLATDYRDKLPPPEACVSGSDPN